jgi:zinc protease
MVHRASYIVAGLLATIVAGQTLSAAAHRAPAAKNTVPPLGYKHRVLRNGLNVYTMRDPRAPNVSVQMWYEVGAKDDPGGRSGFAHLFEHILSRVTRNIPPGGLTRLVEEQAGGSRNAATGPDRTRYYENVPSNRLEAMLWAHAERMGRSVLDGEVLEAERNIIKNEMRETILSQPYGRLQSYYTPAASYTAHPYHRPVIGTIADLDAATLEEARAFHANFYRPDNANLIVSGNFDQAQLDGWIDRHLGALRRPAKPILRHRVVEPLRTRSRSITVYAPNVPLPAVLFTWQRPRLNHPDSATLAVIDYILSAGHSSRLYRSLVDERQLATSAVSTNDGQREAGSFSIQVVVATGHEISDAETALAAEIARLRDEPVSAAELEEARNEFMSQTLFGRETPAGRAFELGTAVTIANDPNWGDKLLAAVQRVTAADVQRVARTYFTDSRRVSIRYLAEAQRPAGQAAYDPSIERTDAALGRTYPPDTSRPNQLAPESDRMEPPAPQAAQPFEPPAFAERRLPNGMRVVVAQSTNVPIATALLVFNGGTAVDPEARPGVASMVSSLVDNGAGGMTAQQIAARVESLGGEIGTSVNQDSSVAFVSAPTATIAAAGAVLAQVVREPAFAPEELERERRRALDQLRVSMRNPSFVSLRVGHRVLYGDAPYGTPAEGTPDSIAAMTRDDVVAYHRKWWRPDNATLVITGALDGDAGFALAERLFGGWAAPAQPMPQMPASRAGQALPPRVIVVDNPAADQAFVAIAMRGIARNDSDYYPLLLANSALGGSPTARLFQEVRVRRALSYGPGSALFAYRDEGVFVAIAPTRNNAVPEVVQVMMSEIRRMREEPITADVLGKRRTQLVGDFARQVATTKMLGNFLANLAVQGLPMSEYASYLSKLQAVTPEQVAASVAAEVDPAQASLVIIGRASEFLEAFRAQYPKVEVIPISELDLGSASLRRKAP